MKRKGLSLLLILGMVFVFAGVSVANVPAPPVNQIVGFDDTEFNGLTADDCKACHPSVVDDHHLLYGSGMIGPGECSLGTCDDTGDVCGGGAPCATGNCVFSSCFINAECATPIDYCTRGEDCPDFLCEDDATPCADDTDCVGIGATETCDDACPSYRGAAGEYSGKTGHHVHLSGAKSIKKTSPHDVRADL